MFSPKVSPGKGRSEIFLRIVLELDPEVLESTSIEHIHSRVHRIGNLGEEDALNR